MTAATETTSGPNADLFVAVLAQIEQHPETWKQTSFRCGTMMCFAGWATHLSGIPWATTTSTEIGGEDVIYGAVRMHVSDAAALLLAVPVFRADQLFAACNTRYDLYRISADLLGIDETVLRDKVAAVVADGATQAASS